METATQTDSHVNKCKLKHYITSISPEYSLFLLLVQKKINMKKKWPYHNCLPGKFALLVFFTLFNGTTPGPGFTEFLKGSSTLKYGRHLRNFLKYLHSVLKCFTDFLSGISLNVKVIFRSNLEQGK
jgi:hypothetical protein